MLKNNIKLLSISKVAIMFGLVNKKNQKPSSHTLRFWEKKFKQLKPTILSGGRRYYSAKNIEVIKMIVYLLKDRGLRINSAVKIMNETTNKLDDVKTSSIRDLYFKNNIKTKSKEILKKIKNLKN
jgi:DNA-binding transcriptional MerR regulator